MVRPFHILHRADRSQCEPVRPAFFHSPHGLDRVRQAAKQKGARFTALLHHIDVGLLGSAYGWLRKEASAGVDGVTWAAYGEGLKGKLTDLHDRIHRGAYRAQPSRRVYIPKPDGRERPLGKL
jgi:hypothetical protein